jgi:hypothetical protein
MGWSDARLASSLPNLVRILADVPPAPIFSWLPEKDWPILSDSIAASASHLFTDDNGKDRRFGKSIRLYNLGQINQNQPDQRG